jgi:hypothetical protein
MGTILVRTIQIEKERATRGDNLLAEEVRAPLLAATAAKNCKCLHTIFSQNGLTKKRPLGVHVPGMFR